MRNEENLAARSKGNTGKLIENMGQCPAYQFALVRICFYLLKKKEIMITQEELKNIVHYDPDTGIFTKSGKPTGFLRSDGYIQLCIFGKKYLGQQIAFLFMAGEIPKKIYIVNKIKSDNRWNNLSSIIEKKKIWELNQEYLKSILHYDPDTGFFTWLKVNSNRVKVGDIAGSKDDKGYIRIMIDGKSEKAHRLAFLYEDGGMPDEVDHLNRIRDDNRWDNLRAATRQQNMINRNPLPSKSGIKGVRKLNNKHQALIWVDGKQKSLGCYSTEEEAQMVHETYESLK